MQTGGCLWFLDPFYILPIAVTGIGFAILELGAESGVDNPNLKAMKTVFRITRFVILTINFPTVVFTYWLTSNCFSLAQVGPAQTPTGQAEPEDPREDQTPGLCPAPERRLHRHHQEGSTEADLHPQPSRAVNTFHYSNNNQVSQSKTRAPATGGKKRPWEETND